MTRRSPLSDDTPCPPELSFVIPVFNGAQTITRVVDEIHDLHADLDLEVILVNDGSKDDSEQTCRGIQEKYPKTVSFLQLSRNFGEHNAVLAGLRQSKGTYVAVLDDDGQNPPAEIRRLYDAIRSLDADVVYGRYQVKHHSRFRNLGSRLNDKMANLMLGKPAELYLSSFKIMNRFVVDQIKRYGGAFPYIDGLILRATGRLAQIDVEHRPRVGSRSAYTTGKLFSLWLNMLLNFSIAPLRVAAVLGAVTSLASLVFLVAIVVDKLFVNPTLTVGIPTILVTVVFFAGVQLLILGAVGEYVGRIFQDQSGKPQFVVRYVQPRTPPR